MKFVVSPEAGRWKWELIDTESGEVFATGVEDKPKEAREAARTFRNRCYLAPIEMGT